MAAAFGQAATQAPQLVGALAHLGYTISDQTIGNILKRHGIPPAPECKMRTT
jgi:putative transposase